MLNKLLIIFLYALFSPNVAGANPTAFQDTTLKAGWYLVDFENGKKSLRLEGDTLIFSITIPAFLTGNEIASYEMITTENSATLYISLNLIDKKIRDYIKTHPEQMIGLVVNQKLIQVSTLSELSQSNEILIEREDYSESELIDILKQLSP